jgi:chemotaxis signal transduction protein
LKKRLSLGRLKLESDSKKLLNIVGNVSASRNIVVFRLGNDPWAFSIDFLVRALRAQKYTFFSDSSDISFVRGYIFFNKEAIPVFTIHKILELPPITDIDLRTSILLCKVGDFKFGLLSEEVLEITPVDEKIFCQIPNNFLIKYRQLIKGAHTWRDKVALLLDLQNLLSKEDLSMLNEEGEKIRAEQEGK